MMDEEERDDSQMRERFKTKWTPKPSVELTMQLRQEAEKYRGIMENAMRADGVVREKYNKHRRHMDLLSKGEVGDSWGAHIFKWSKSKFNNSYKFYFGT